ncbi:tRNA (adenosine(37)-N6)-threonylcarbamoyltransferase complex ATPase subunit type 1 TsaE [Flavobacterium sp.]|uniref:tRNA (adenosine(37)-N6)-threonylcarbamoyltransferase complex ATPase subunit type 1 TsaE n=1 Tax=Flavobacterium sp. TaxID=239 RepID=UPI003529092D
MTFIYSLNEIKNIAQQILAIPQLKKVILFNAEMGAGKTTLIKALTKELGVIDNSSSPTFSLVNEYHTENNQIIYHFDLYRLNSEIEAYDMGIDEYFYSGNWCFIEWPEKVPNLIPLDHASISISVLPNEMRQLTITN